jgi:hypothetical protein
MARFPRSARVRPGPGALCTPGTAVLTGHAPSAAAACASQRRARRKVHSGAGARAAVTDRLWTVRGRELACCRSPVPGNPVCCCVRVSQSPVLIPGPLAGGAPVPICRGAGDAAAGGGQAHEGAVRARRRAGQHQHAATVARSITNPDRQAQTLATVAEALAARGETRQARHVASVACAVGQCPMALMPVLSLEPSAIRVPTDP